MPDSTPPLAQYTSVIPLHRGFYVYRCWTADDICIYVGRSEQVLRRLGAHALVGWWKGVHHVDVAVMASSIEAAAEEIAQIRHWRPINNSDYNINWVRQPRPSRVTHCPANHEYTPANTLYNSRGSKICRECKNAKARAKRVRKGVARGERRRRTRAVSSPARSSITSTASSRAARCGCRPA